MKRQCHSVSVNVSVTVQAKMLENGQKNVILCDESRVLDCGICESSVIENSENQQTPGWWNRQTQGT